MSMIMRRFINKLDKKYVKAAEEKSAAEKAKELGLTHPVAARVIAAYSDQWEDVKDPRNLDYFEETPVNGKDLIEIMSAAVEGYNDFSGKESTEQIVQAFGEDESYHIAREGSVCIYVKPKAKNYWLHKLEQLNVDEALFDGKKMMFRFWWD